MGCKIFDLKTGKLIQRTTLELLKNEEAEKQHKEDVPTMEELVARIERLKLKLLKNINNVKENVNE